VAEKNHFRGAFIKPTKKLRNANMTTQKILSTITLIALSLSPFGSARASVTSIGTTGTKDASELGRSVKREPEGPLLTSGKRPISVGFAQNSPLRSRLQAKLAAAGRYALQDAQQIPENTPGRPSGLFVSGFVANTQPEHGWWNCHARYFIASQPELAALQVESVAASVPIMEVHIFRDRPELLELAQEACLDQLADQIVEGMSKL
jgi:hypothetical protein